MPTVIRILYLLWLLIIAPIALTVTVLTALTTIIFSALGMGRSMGYYPEIAWSRILLALTLVRVTVKGRSNVSPGTGYVFVANHQSAYDIFTIYGYLGHNFRWLMKRSLRKMPLIGYACHASGQVFVDNSSPSAVRRTMEEAEDRLAGGMSIVVFPEGARTFTGKMRPFKRGAFTLAMEFGLPVVPVTIDGAFDVMPRFKRLPSPGHITLTIHRPLPAPEAGQDMRTLMDHTQSVIDSALPQRHRAQA